MHLLSTMATDIDEPKASCCQKLLFSATLMSDPAKLRALDLRDPQYVILQSTGPGADAGGGGAVCGGARWAVGGGWGMRTDVGLGCVVYWVF